MNRELPFDSSADDPRVEVLKALAHPVRIRILEALEGRELCACKIAELFNCDRTTVSKHLSLMRGAGILYCRKEGLNVYYGIQMHCLTQLLSCLGRLCSPGESGGGSCSNDMVCACNVSQ